MKKWIYILLVFIPLLGNAQTFSADDQQKIDAMGLILNDPNSHDTLMAQTFVNLSEILYMSSFDTMYSLNQQAREIAEKGLIHPKTEKIRISLTRSLAASLGNIGFVSNYKGDKDEALNYYEKSLELSKKTNDKNGMSSMFNNIGLMYSNKGDTKKALEYYNQCLNIRLEIDDKKGLATIYNNIGAEYRKQGELNKTLEYYKKSLSYSQQINNERNIGRNLNNIGFIYFSLNEMDTALNYWEQSLTIREKIGDEYGLAESYMNLASIKKYNKEFDQALDYLTHTLMIYNKLGIKTSSLSSVYSKMSGIYYQKNEIKLALSYGNKGLDLATKNEFLEGLMLNAQNLYEIHKSIGNTKAALDMHELYINTRDSIQSDKNKQEIIKNQFRYEYEKQHLADSLAFAKEEELKEFEHQTQLDKEQNQKNYLYVGIFVLLIMGGMAFNGFQKKKKANKLIIAQKIEVEHQKLIVDEKNKEITDSIQYAKRIQSAILPSFKQVKEYLPKSFILYKPKDIVAGDFYWLEPKENQVLFAAADCTGHGVPGAMVSVVCNNGLNRSVREYGLTNPGEILDKTREIVVQEFEKSEEEVKDGMDIALCSIEGNIFKYAGANNPLWIVRNSEIIEETKPNKQPIGQFDNPEPYTTHTFELQKGDTIYVFSDGYVDQFGGEKGKKFKTANFKKLLLSIQHESMEQQKELVNRAFENWKGDLEQLDDVCVIGVRV